MNRTQHNIMVASYGILLHLELFMGFLHCLASGLAFPHMVVASKGLQLCPVKQEQASGCTTLLVPLHSDALEPEKRTEHGHKQHIEKSSRSGRRAQK